MEWQKLMEVVIGLTDGFVHASAVVVLTFCQCEMTRGKIDGTSKDNLMKIGGIQCFVCCSTCQWKAAGKTPLFELELFRAQMGLGDNEYRDMSNFKKRVLDLAVNEINEKTDLTVSYTQEKKGRLIHGFKFTVKQKQVQKPSKNARIDDKDANTLDMFHKLTEKQIGVFSRKLAQLPELGSSAPLGKTMDEFIQIIANDLKDEKKQAKYQPYLEKLGFK